MLSKKRLRMVIKENEPYLNAYEEFDRTHKLMKVKYKERVNFTIDSDIIRRYRKYCKKNSISMSNKIESMIIKFLKTKKVEVK